MTNQNVHKGPTEAAAMIDAVLRRVSSTAGMMRKWQTLPYLSATLLIR